MSLRKVIDPYVASLYVVVGALLMCALLVLAAAVRISIDILFYGRLMCVS